MGRDDFVRRGAMDGRQFVDEGGWRRRASRDSWSDVEQRYGAGKM